MLTVHRWKKIQDPDCCCLKVCFLFIGFDAEKNGEVGTKGGVVGLVSFSTVNGFPRLGYFRLGLLLDESSILC